MPNAHAVKYDMVQAPLSIEYTIRPATYSDRFQMMPAPMVAAMTKHETDHTGRGNSPSSGVSDCGTGLGVAGPM